MKTENIEQIEAIYQMLMNSAENSTTNYEASLFTSDVESLFEDISGDPAFETISLDQLRTANASILLELANSYQVAGKDSMAVLARSIQNYIDNHEEQLKAAEDLPKRLLDFVYPVV